MGIMTPEQADALLARGSISPAAHAAIVGPAQEPKLIDMFGGSQLPPVSSLANGVPMKPPPPVGPGIDGALEHLAAVQPAGAARPPLSVAPTEMPVAAPTREPVSFARDPRPAPAPRSGGGGGPDPRMTAADHQVAALEREQSSARRQTDMDQIQASERADEEAGKVAELRAIDARNAEARSKEDAEVQRRVEETDSAVNEYAKSKIDPGRLWHNMGEGSRALASVSVLLAGIGNTLSRKDGNPALDLLERAVDRDIRAQEVDQAKQGQAVQAKRGVLSDMMAITRNKDSARSAAKIAYLENADAQMRATAAKYASPAIAERAEQVSAQIQGRVAALRDDVKIRQATEARAAAAGAASAAYQHKKDDRAYNLDVAKVRIDATKAQADAANKTNDATTKRASLDADLAVLDKAFGQASQNLPILGTGRLPTMTDSGKDYDAATAAIISAAKGEGESSDLDVERVGRMAPLPGDSEGVLKRKYELLRAKVVAKHSSQNNVAAERARNPDTAVGFKPVQ